MKKRFFKEISLFLFCLLLFSCHSDEWKNSEHQEYPDHQKLGGTTTVVDQTQLNRMYSEGTAFGKILSSDFFKSNEYDIRSERESFITLDEDHIQVFDSENIHAVTYRVYVNEGDSDKIYNLMYYSKDRNDYYVTLLLYDFSEISFASYRANPTNEVLSVIPMNEYEDIYVEVENAIRSGGQYFYREIVPLADCVQEMVVAGSTCKGDAHHSYGDPSCNYIGDGSGREATPGYTYMDFSDCGGGQSGSGGSSPGPGNPGGPGGPGGGGPHPGTGFRPIGYVNVIKDKLHVIGSGVFLSQVNIGQNIPSRKVLSQIRTGLRADIIELNGKLSETREYGYAYRFTRNGQNLINNGRSDLFNPVNEYNKIDVSKASFNNFLGVIHTHPIKYFDGMAASERKDTPMFSPADLMGLFKYTNRSSQDPQRTPSEAFVGVVNKHGMYAVMLPDNITYENMAAEYADFANFSQQGAFLRIKVDETKEKWGDISDDLKREYEKIEKSSDSDSVKKTKHEKALLEVLKRYNLKMNLYHLAPNNGTFNGNWQRVQLTSTNQVEHITLN